MSHEFREGRQDFRLMRWERVSALARHPSEQRTMGNALLLRQEH